MAKSKVRKKKSKNKTKTPKGNVLRPFVEYQEYRHILKDVYLPDGKSLKKGQGFYLKDAYVEDDGKIVIGIVIDEKVYESVYYQTAKTIDVLKEFVNTITCPYQGMKGFESRTIIYVPFDV